MDRPPADPVALLAAWMEWERGETPPGRVISTLKTGGMRDVLETLAAAAQPVTVDAELPDTEAWTPVV